MMSLVMVYDHDGKCLCVWFSAVTAHAQKSFDFTRVFNFVGELLIEMSVGVKAFEVFQTDAF